MKRDLRLNFQSFIPMLCNKYEQIMLSYLLSVNCQMHHEIGKQYVKILSIGKIFQISSKTVFSDFKSVAKC